MDVLIIPLSIQNLVAILSESTPWRSNVSFVKVAAELIFGEERDFGGLRESM